MHGGQVDHVDRDGTDYQIDVWDRGDALIALNNRTLAWYSTKGVVNAPVLYRQPDPQEARLNDVPSCLGESLPSINIAITTKTWKQGCGETLGAVTSIVRAAP